jgi:hypothetical protein
MNFEFQDSAGGVEESLEHLKSELAREYPNVRSVARRRFVMADNLADKVLAREKCTTIRFDKHAVEYPAGSVLPLYAIEEGKDHGEARCRADLLLRSVRYELVEGLTEKDALADGFRSREELIKALKTFYGELSPSDVVCIYAFSLVQPGPQRQYGGSRSVAANMVSV